MTKYYSYVIPRDFGFAPNPFGEHCTLATCKPSIRKSAEIGDWIFGTSSTLHQKPPRLIYAMQVTGKMAFNEYYNYPDFQYKKPVMNGSLKKMYGDNIYHQNIDGNWLQDDSHHSLDNGEINQHNLKRDTSTTNMVLISNYFYYFGKEAFEITSKYSEEFCKKGPGHRYVDEEIALKILAHIQKNYNTGLIGFPSMFQEEHFVRYDGQS